MSNSFNNGSFFSKVELTLSNSDGETASFKLNSITDDKLQNNQGGMYILDLTYTRVSGGGTGNVLEVNIVDNTSCGIEKKLTQYFRNLKFSYTGLSVVGDQVQENIHGPYNMLVTDWSANITPYGSQIRLQAISVALANLKRNLKLKKDKNGKGIDYIQGAPHEIVKKVFDMCGVGYETRDKDGKTVSLIEETNTVYVKNKEGDNQDENVPKKYKYEGGSALDFLNGVVLQDAVSKNADHKRKYVLRYYDKLTDKGKPIGVFMSEDNFNAMAVLSREHDFSFEYNTRNSNITNWSPTYQGKTLLGICGVKLTYTAPNGETGEVYAKDNKEPQQDGEKPLERFFLGTKEEAQAAADFMLKNRRFSAQKATMEVVNYNNIEVGDMVKVKVIEKDGNFHHTSGVWYVKKVSDKITGGLVTTKLELQLFRPLEEVEKNIADRYLLPY